MAKYHINPETGNPGKCTAQVKCRFGGDAAHYGSAEEARSAYEVTQAALESMKKDPAFNRGEATPVPVAREELMSSDQVAHRVGPYFVSTRAVQAIGAKPGTFDKFYETIVVDENDPDGLPVFEEASRDKADGPVNHERALAFAQARLASPVPGLPLQLQTVPGSDEVVGEIDEDGFVASTYPAHEGFTPKPVRAEVVDPATGKSGFLAVRPRQGYKTHVMRDQPRWRQEMGLGKLIIYGRSLCGEAGKSSSMIAGGHNDPTPPSQALKEARDACEACAKKYADPKVK